MPTRREHRPIEFQCQDCGYEFVASVPHLVDYAGAHRCNVPIVRLLEGGSAGRLARILVAQHGPGVE